ncbi:uncharacterized protein LOC119745248 [Patiria miniata]|uniref:C2H2-type domain-containing protein n=1 Tax=Patiria miniata TaxID=46514 RepID=A0A914BN73_PATMI|nr:uncharacterized protein LOC119745248 [Patiria miniata]
MMKETAQSTLGPKKRVHQDWFDENDKAIAQLLDDKRKAFMAWQNDMSSTSKRNCFKQLQSQAQAALRCMQDEWLEKKADEVQLYADTKNSKMFFSSIKAVYGPSKPSTTPLLSANGTLLKEKSAINKRWREHFSTLLNRPSTEEDMPQEFRDATIVSLFKNKGSKSDCGNFRGISLLSIAGKVLARIILNRLVTAISEENLPEAQCGFRPGRSTIDMIFAVHQVQEKCKEQNMDLYAVFIDLTKAFDTVNREALLIILGKFGCPRKFVSLIRLFYDNMTGLVLSGGEASEKFEISNGVKQGLGKTEVLFQSTLLSVASRPSISIEGTELKTVDDFKYLGSVISSDGSLDKEINARICKASQALGRLRSCVLKQHNIRQTTKLKVYKTVALTSLLYGCETWTLYRRHIKQLERFHVRRLRSILGIRWQDRITNLEVLDRAETTSIKVMILKAQLRWTGHVIQMDDSRIPKQILYGELCLGKRNWGRPKKRFKDSVKANIVHAGIPPKQLEERAQDPAGWRAVTKQATDSFEKSRRNSVMEARERRKAAAAAVPTAPGQFLCSHCGCLCRSRLGLHSHMRVHTTSK